MDVRKELIRNSASLIDLHQLDIWWCSWMWRNGMPSMLTIYTTIQSSTKKFLYAGECGEVLNESKAPVFSLVPFDDLEEGFTSTKWSCTFSWWEIFGRHVGGSNFILKNLSSAYVFCPHLFMVPNLVTARVIIFKYFRCYPSQVTIKMQG